MRLPGAPPMALVEETARMLARLGVADGAAAQNGVRGHPVRGMHVLAVPDSNTDDRRARLHAHACASGGRVFYVHLTVRRLSIISGCIVRRVPHHDQTDLHRGMHTVAGPTGVLPSREAAPALTSDVGLGQTFDEIQRVRAMRKYDWFLALHGTMHMGYFICTPVSLHMRSVVLMRKPGLLS